MSATGYSIQENHRAKCVRVKVSLYDGRVVVVVPPGFDRDQIPGIVREKQSWIERAQRQVNEQRELAGTNGSSDRPEQVLLRALGEEWTVSYDCASTSGVTLCKRGEGALLLRGETASTALCHLTLQRWLRRKAHTHLVPWLQTVSRHHDLPLTRAVVRAQRSRWGSCSRHHTISINQKLLFLPPALVRYVFLHELCHVVHFDHSPAFWRFLEQREPRYRQLDAELDTAWRYVPLWAFVPTPGTREEL